MRKLLENAVEATVFASRWLQMPLYLGLIVGSVLYAYKFLEKLLDMTMHVSDWNEEQLMLGILGLVDMTMVANLVYMVVVGG